MGIRIGTEFLGKVDAVGAESIQTKFFVVGGPIVPLESYYVLQETFRGVNGFRIPLHAKSVVLGYIRNWLFIPALLFWVFGIALASDGFAWMVYPAALATAAWLVCWLALGRPSAEERKRRETLRSLVGVAAMPRMIPMDVAMRLRAKLAESARALGLADDRAAIGSVTEPRTVGLAWALALYSGWDDIADRLWSVVDGASATAAAASAALPSPDSASAGAITPR